MFKKAQSNLDGGPFVTKLPYDVLESILSKLTLRERIPCTQVCKAWRSLLLSLPAMWSDLSGCDLGHDLIPYNINGELIRRVDLTQHNLFPIAFLVQLGCSNIRTIQNARYYGEAGSFHFNHIQDLLDLTGHALTSLEITAFDRTLDDFLTMTLTTCPNLVHLDLAIGSGLDPFARPRNTKVTADSSIIQSVQRIVDLTLGGKGITVADIKRILPLFTGLKHFQFNNDPEDPEFLDWVDNTFPRLQTIRIGKGAFECPPSKYGGALTKALSCDTETTDRASVERMLDKYGSIMSAFHIKENLVQAHNCYAIQNCIALGAPRLRSLIIKSKKISVPLFDIEHVLHQLPCLERLVLVNVTLSITDDFPVSNQKTLKTIKLWSCKGVTAAKLQTVTNRLHPFVNCVSLLGLDEDPFGVLETIPNHIVALDLLEVRSQSVSYDKVMSLIDNWRGQRLGKLKIDYSTRKLTIKHTSMLNDYAKEALPRTNVTFSQL